MATHEPEKGWRHLLTPGALGAGWVLLSVLIVCAIYAVTGWPFLILWALLGLPAVCVTIPVARMLSDRLHHNRR